MHSAITSTIQPNYAFAFENGTNVSSVVDDASASEMNFETGMVAKPEYNQQGQNVGNKVLVGDFNLIGKMGCNANLFRLMGGVRTFDSAFCAKIGGYPKGAQLELLVEPSGSGNYALRKVLSLVENNTYDFVTNGVDDEHWTYCDTLNPVLFPRSEFPAINVFHYIIVTNSPTGSQSASRSVTLQSDCALYYDGEIQDITRNGFYVNVAYGGTTKVFAKVGPSGIVSGNNGKIVRAGSKITAGVSISRGGDTNFSVVAIPVSNRIQRI